ncbi:hypothetical protein PR002_g30432 [Phytophthora rubi]|uniref:Uncharacterized protein n=1 Tax=Phytophthora rubi TaxID=129364 RepID=A0A6A3GQJ9_9STRA|nr:hypothetical protein PR002_g30432 [Phytophthora rubi]
MTCMLTPKGLSNIVTNPIDEATKVVTFMKGLKDGPVKTYLF